jgi:hypothetical protein
MRQIGIPKIFYIGKVGNREVSRESGSKLDRIFSPVLAIGRVSQPSSPCFSPRFFDMFAFYASRCFDHHRWWLLDLMANQPEANPGGFGCAACSGLASRPSVQRAAVSTIRVLRCSAGARRARGCAGGCRRRTRTSLIPREAALSPSLAGLRSLSTYCFQD